MLKNKVLALFSLSIFLLLLIFSPIALAQDESVTFTTYYPSPYGDYNNLTTNNFIARENVTLATEPGSRVGIGTTNPDSILTVSQPSGDSLTGLRFVTTDAATNNDQLKISWFQRGTLDGATREIAKIASVLESATSHGGRLAFSTMGGAVLSERMRIDERGNVGIGTTSPNTNLHIKGLPGYHAQLKIESPTAGLPYLIFADGNNNYQHLFYSNSGDLNFRRCTNAGCTGVPGQDDVQMVIKNNGNVGIGTTSPNGALEIYRTTDHARLRLTTRNNIGYVPIINLKWSYADGSNIQESSWQQVNGASYLDSNSHWRISGRMYFYNGHEDVSSRTLKENITPIENALDKILKLQGVYFDWKADGRHDIGLIAEDVQPIIPEVVHQEGALPPGLAYDRLIALSIEAIKELKAENNEFSARLSALEAKTK